MHCTTTTITAAPHKYALIKCALCAGLCPNIARLGRFKEPTNNAKLPPNSKHSHKKANVVTKIVQSDLSEVSLHPAVCWPGAFVVRVFV